MTTDLGQTKKDDRNEFVCMKRGISTAACLCREKDKAMQTNQNLQNRQWIT